MKAWILGALLAAGTSAQAHDSWFERQPGGRPGEVRMKLGTGNQFPVMETSVGDGALARHGCRQGDGADVPMVIRNDTASALQLRATLPARRAAHGAVSCWAHLVSFELEGLAPDKVELYFKEMAASDALRQTWKAMAARGLPWRETYTKHARIELFDARLGSETPPAAVPVPMGMDIVFDGPLAPPKAGDTVSFRLLRDGQPLASFPVELRSSLSAIGIWMRTDAEGRAKVRVPLAGDWLLRAIDLRVSDRDPDRWDSRFVTLAFEVQR